MLVRHRLAVAHPRIRTHHQHRLCIIDTGGQRACGEAAEHHRMNRANACAGQHRKGRLGDHRHVDQHPVATLDSQLLVDRRHALHFALQFGKGVHLLFVGLGRDVHQRTVVGPLGSVAVDRVVAKIGLAALEPFHERRLRVVADLLDRLVPVHELGLLRPESITVIDRAAIKLLVVGHCILSLVDSLSCK